jgi:uncharacterized membrane protein HdeD (DUF308 family)
VLIYPGWGVAALVFWLSVGLLFLGLRSIGLVGYGGLSNGIKALSVIAGILSLILAVLVIVFPGYGVATLLWFVSFGLMVYGFGRMFLAYILKAAAGWMRGSMVAVGVFDVILSVLVLLLPEVSLLTLVVLLAVVLIVSGVEAIVSGAVGRTWLGNLVEAVKKEM